MEAALGLLDEAPAIVMSRCLAQLTRDAIEKKDETLLTKLAETIVERALEDAYASLSSILQSGISKELYSYLALLLAGTNRPTLLAVLEEQLEQDILRRPAILDALRVRTTPEQAAIIQSAGKTAASGLNGRPRPHVTNSSPRPQPRRMGCRPPQRSAGPTAICH